MGVVWSALAARMCGPRPWQKVHACRQRYRACQDPAIHPEFLIQRQQGGNRNQKNDCAGAVEV